MINFLYGVREKDPKNLEPISGIKMRELNPTVSKVYQRYMDPEGNPTEKPCLST